MNSRILNRGSYNYILKTFINYYEKPVCPFCNFDKNKIIDRKRIIFRLYECLRCHLYFRHPYDHQIFNYNFYEKNYIEPKGITTNLPSDEEMLVLKESNFTNTEKNADVFVKLFKILSNNLSPLSVIDYGSSWGYMSYQFKRSGFDVQSFEISRTRAGFGNNKLGLNIKTSENELIDNNDIFFSSHVIEHHNDIQHMLSLAKRLLKTNGFFIAESPNGSKEFRKNNSSSFHKMWGLVHPNLISADFYKFLFKNSPFFITSSPYNIYKISNWNQSLQEVTDTSGDQLIIIAKPNIVL